MAVRSLKTPLLIIVCLFTGAGAIIQRLLNKDPTEILLAGALCLFLILALWKPPKRHRSFSYFEERKTMMLVDPPSEPLLPPGEKEENSESKHRHLHNKAL